MIDVESEQKRYRVEGGALEFVKYLVGNLAALSGVGFEQAGDGAISRTAEDKLRETVSNL